MVCVDEGGGGGVVSEFVASGVMVNLGGVVCDCIKRLTMTDLLWSGLGGCN